MPVSLQQFEDSARVLNVDVPALKAVAKIEGNGQGIINGRPVILFEPHVFYKQLRAEGITPVECDICYPVWGTLPYPKGQDAQWQRLDKASKISRTAALKSASWGMFQCMGYNYPLTGCSDLQEFVNAMYRSENEQLRLFVNYIKNTFLDDELRHKDWRGFAAAYNGKYYFKNDYDKKLQAAYETYA